MSVGLRSRAHCSYNTFRLGSCGISVRSICSFADSNEPLSSMRRSVAVCMRMMSCCPSGRALLSPVASQNHATSSAFHSACVCSSFSDSTTRRIPYSAALSRTAFIMSRMLSRILARPDPMSIRCGSYRFARVYICDGLDGLAGLDRPAPLMGSSAIVIISVSASNGSMLPFFFLGILFLFFFFLFSSFFFWGASFFLLWITPSFFLL